MVQLWIVLGAHVGVSCSWFAVQGVSRAAALEALGLVEAGPVRGDFPARDGVTDLPNGWLLLWFEDLGRAFAPDVVALSAQGRAVACSIEEHVMEHEARGYEKGQETWRLRHDPEAPDGMRHLEVTGAPPPPFERIRDDQLAKLEAQGDIADFVADVPAALAMTICGFKHDEEWPDEVSFTELKRTKLAQAEGRPGFFARLFGRG